MHKVAILDCGAQYAKVIDRRVRELQVHSDILPLDADTKVLQQYDAIILSGGPASVYGKEAPSFNPMIFRLGKPILGICYGVHLINYVLEGIVEQKKVKEYGETNIIVDRNALLFKGLAQKQQVLMSHGDSIIKPAPGFRVIAKSGDIIAAIANEKARIYGLQFHPEVDLTINGKHILSNFLFRVANLKAEYTIEKKIEDSVAEIRKRVGKKKIISLISGGVDSAVATTLVLQALDPKQVYAIHVDTGFMRKQESEQVCEALKSLGLKHFKLIHAQKMFYQALKGAVEPEKKRKIIGDLFMKIVDKEIKKLKLKNPFLVQGTLRPDLIESASEMVTKTADTIKTHHNDTKLVREKRKKGLVIEPNKDLHKDEVRQIGRTLGLPTALVERQPFPGPGLAVRILCSKKPYLEQFDDVNKRLQQVAQKFGLRAQLLPVLSVGVQGDFRTYKYTACLSGLGEWRRLKRAAMEIPRLVHEINRVVYVFEHNLVREVKDIIPTTLISRVVALLQEADDVVTKKLAKYGLLKHIAQMPVILLPVSLDSSGDYTVVLRPFITNDFMTGRAAVFGNDIPIPCLKEMVHDIRQISGISNVVYDLTSKPPGTTEWE